MVGIEQNDRDRESERETDRVIEWREEDRS